jgi:uncharacterized coiled-coil protein SlyX
MSDSPIEARLAELELRYMELQHEVEVLGEVVRELDQRLDRAEATVAGLQAGDPFDE